MEARSSRLKGIAALKEKAAISDPVYLPVRDRN
jgi:hypothetical protein